MNADGTTPLGPLMPEIISHLSASLGPPREFLLSIQGGRDIHASAWLVGHGHVEAPGNGNATRTLDVEIRLTPEGNFVVTRINRTVGADSSVNQSSTGGVRSTPAALYDWLLSDAKGKLGPASKAAWVQACRTVPPMNGLEFERIA